MAGLDKMMSQILDDASREANEITKRSQEEADAIIAQAKEECVRMEEVSKEKQANLKKSQEERIASSAQLKKRQTILLAKQQIISEMIESAYKELLSLSDSEYFVMVEKMLQKFVLAKAGQIYFSEKDLNRMPSGFEAKIEEIASKNGGSLTLVKEAKEVDGGFILVYGGVEENCTFRALLNAKRDDLADKVQRLLFA